MKDVITLGSDPEFCILDKHRDLVPAYEFFNGVNCSTCEPCNCCDLEKCPGSKSRCGACDGCIEECDDCTVCYDCNKCNDDSGNCFRCDSCKEERNESLHVSEIGIDGCEDVGELRPIYADNPIDHHNNIQHLINQIDTSGGHILRAGTIVKGNPIGGHIHIGGFNQPLMKNSSDHTWIINMKHLSNYLSLYAGIPLRKIEHPADLKYRGMTPNDYGFFGCSNYPEYGCEWRMPASWLVDSEIALSALSLAYVVASEYKNNPKYIIYNEDKIDMKKLLALRNVKSIIKKIESMEKYSHYSKEIEPLFQTIINEKKWEDKVNFKDTW